MDSLAQRIKKFLFIILLLSIPLGEIIRIPIFGNKQINITTIFAGTFVLFSVFLSKIDYKKSKLTSPILFLLAILALSLIFNIPNLRTDELLTSFFYLLRFVIFAGIYFAVLSFDSKFKKRIPYFMLGAGAMVLSLGFVQYFLYPNLRNLYYLGWDEHLYRLFSSFLDPNFAGAILSLFFILILDKFTEKKRWWLGMLGILDLAGIVLTYSRSAYLMLLVGVLTILYLKGRKRLILGLISVFVIGILFSSLVLSKSEGTNLLRTTSSFARLSSSRDAIEIFKKSPVFGVGFDAYEFALSRHGFSMPSNYINHAAAGADNSFLFILATTGVLGLVAFLYFWQKALSMNKNNRLWPVLVSSFLALIMGSIFVNLFFYSFIMIWMWVVLALSED